MNEIYIRRSVRVFQDKEVEEAKVEQLLKAAMQAPSAGNQQPWEFIIIRNKDTLQKLSKVSIYAKSVMNSSVTIVLLANKNTFRYDLAWQQDMGAATQNMLLEAVSQDLGAVWLGVATDETISKNVSELFQLPENIIPFAMVAVGYADGEGNYFTDRYDKTKVHYESYEFDNFES